MLFVSTDFTKGSCNTKCKNGVAIKPLHFLSKEHKKNNEIILENRLQEKKILKKSRP